MVVTNNVFNHVHMMQLSKHATSGSRRPALWASVNNMASWLYDATALPG